MDITSTSIVGRGIANERCLLRPRHLTTSNTTNIARWTALALHIFNLSFNEEGKFHCGHSYISYNQVSRPMPCNHECRFFLKALSTDVSLVQPIGIPWAKTCWTKKSAIQRKMFKLDKTMNVVSSYYSIVSHSWWSELIVEHIIYLQNKTQVPVRKGSGILWMWKGGSNAGGNV